MTAEELADQLEGQADTGDRTPGWGRTEYDVRILREAAEKLRRLTQR